MAKSQVQSLQVFRAFAALAVVAHHAALSTAAFVGALPAPLAAWLGMGYLGVDFFFVLSGFIIMYAHMDDERTPATVKRYAFKRLTRIYPAYVPVGVAMIVLYAAMPGFSAAGGGDVITACLVLCCCCLPMARPPCQWPGHWSTN